MMLKIMIGNMEWKIYDHITELEFEGNYMLNSINKDAPTPSNELHKRVCGTDSIMDISDYLRVVHPPYLDKGSDQIDLDEKILTPFALNNKTMFIGKEGEVDDMEVSACDVVNFIQHTKLGEVNKRIAFNYKAYLLNDEGETVEKLGR